MAEPATKRKAAERRGLPRYAQIRRALETAIVSGDWPPGHRIPSEQQLLRRYRCSRMTVNKALSALADSGMIVRRRRAGSFVSSPNGRNVLEIQDVERDIARHGRSYRVALLSRSERNAGENDALLLGVDPGAPILALRCVHFVDEGPWLLEDRLINLAAVPTARDADFRSRSPGSWLLEQVPWSEAKHEIRAENASAEVAQALSIQQGFACLVVERTTRLAAEVVTHVVLHYPSDRHKLIAQFTPGG
jgi:GntR family histidine utilization transcriptional repressor